MQTLRFTLLSSAAVSAMFGVAVPTALAVDLIDAPPADLAADTSSPSGLHFAGGWTMLENSTLLVPRRTMSYTGTVSFGSAAHAGIRFEVDSTGDSDPDFENGRTTFFAGSSFGRVEYGNAATATDALHIQGVNALGVYDSFDLGEDRNVFWSPMLGFGRVSRRGPETVDDEATIRFMSPPIGGFSVGVSYTSNTDTVRVSDGLNMKFEDMVSFATRYATRFGNTDATFYGGYEKSNLMSQPQDIATLGAMFERGAVTVAAGVGYEDVESGIVGFRGFMHGHSTAWADIGASYAHNDWTFSLGAAWETRTPGAFTSDVTELQDFGLSTSFKYRVAPGFSVLGTVTHYRLETDTEAAGFGDGVGLYATPGEATTTVSLATRVRF